MIPAEEIIPKNILQKVVKYNPEKILQEILIKK